MFVTEQSILKEERIVFDSKMNTVSLVMAGVFEPSHMRYVNDSDEAGEPSLAQMVEKAIHLMKKNTKGYVLFVEGVFVPLKHQRYYKI